MRLRSSLAVSTCVAIAGTLAIAPSASAATSSSLASAILTNPAVITGSQLVSGPASTLSTLAATVPLAGFPRAGTDFAILSSGLASQAYGAQSDQRSTPFNPTIPARSPGGSDRDNTVLRIDLVVPPGNNCLMGVDFRFLSEEYPEYVGQTYSDAFIAELDSSTWTSVGTTITAPNNFAFDSSGQEISINAAGTAGLSAGAAAGTAYDGATPVLTARTPISPGPHSLFFTIFDQFDNAYDSAVFIDNLRVGQVGNPATDCPAGATTAPLVPLIAVDPAPVVFTDPFGTASDTYTIPTTTGVTYQIGGVSVAAGTYSGAGTVVVTTVAQAGYELTGATSFTHTFSTIQQATAEAPTQVDTWGTADDTYTIASTTGVRYEVGGVTVAAGTHPYTGAGTVVVTAFPEPGYVLSGPTSFSLPFTDIRQVSADAPTQVDTWGTADDTYSIASTTGVRYEVGGVTVAAGTYAGTGTVGVNAFAETGYVLTGPSSFSLPFTDILEAIAVAPSKADNYGTVNDTYTVPTVTGVRYEVGGSTVAAGTYSYTGAGTVVVDAFAEPGYELTGPSTFSLVFTDIRLVSAVAPGMVDDYGTAGDTYTIASTTGVRYEVGGVTLAAGTYAGTGTVVVNAFAEAGYVLSGATSFSLPFTDIRLVTAEAPTMVDPYNTVDDTYTIPTVTGVRYEVGGVTVAAGTYSGLGTVVVNAFAESGFLLSGATSFSLPFTDIRLVTAEAPGQFDTYDTVNDTYTIPVVEGVRYEVGGVTVPAGTYPGLGTVVVDAFAETGYDLTGASQFTLVFTDIHQVTADAPGQVDAYDTVDDTYTIASTTGVRYEVGGVTVVAGTYPGLGTVVVTAFAEVGYELAGQDVFTLVFTDIHQVTADAPGQVDAYDTVDDTYTIASTTGVRYEVGGVTVAAGTYPGLGTVVVTAFAEVGYELAGQDVFTLVFTDIHQVTAEAPTHVDTYDTADDTYTIPSVTGVRYEVDGVTVVAGTYPGLGTVVVTAFAEVGYELAGQDVFTLVFTDVHQVTAEAPGQVDTWGTDDDTYTIPVVTGVRYEVDGVPTVPGTYAGAGSMVVTAFAEAGYELEGENVFALEFTDIRLVSALPPTGVDTWGVAADTYTIPSVVGVRYEVDGVVTPAGTYPGSGTVLVTAVAEAGYVLTGQDEFPLEFTDIRQATAVAPPSTDRNGTANDTYTIPDVEGVTYWINGVRVAAGTYAGSGTITVEARAAAGYVLSGPTVFSLVFDATQAPRLGRDRGDDVGDRAARAGRLPKTGSESVRIVWLGALMLLAGVGAVTVAGRGRQQR